MSDAPIRYNPQSSNALSATTGRPSRRADLLPVALRERYTEILNDPDYLSSRENISSMEMRVQELYKRAYEENPLAGKAYNNIAYKIRKLKYRVKDELAEGASAEDVLQTIGNELQQLYDYASHEDRTAQCWDEIRRFELTMGKLKDTDVKRMVAANQCLTVPESYNLVQRLVNIIETYLEDKELRARAIRELHLLLERKGTR